jgi:hypothetical protein
LLSNVGKGLLSVNIPVVVYAKRACQLTRSYLSLSVWTHITSILAIITFASPTPQSFLQDALSTNILFSNQNRKGFRRTSLFILSVVALYFRHQSPSLLTAIGQLKIKIILNFLFNTWFSGLSKLQNYKFTLELFC